MKNRKSPAAYFYRDQMKSEFVPHVEAKEVSGVSVLFKLKLNEFHFNL